MSRHRPNPKPGRRAVPSMLFAAMGDETRLALVAKLSAGGSCSISQLTEGSRLTRQAITKHLRVLTNAGLARCIRSGRETLYRFEPYAIVEMHEYLDTVSRQWDEALSRLKVFVED